MRELSLGKYRSIAQARLFIFLLSLSIHSLLRFHSNFNKLILFGANDACLKDGPTSQHVPLQIYRENLKTILNHSSITAHSPTIFLVTPPPINEVHLEVSSNFSGY